MSGQFDSREVRDCADEGAGDAAQADELGRAARTTSRKLLTLLAIGATLFLVIHFTPFGQKIREWDTLAELFEAKGVSSDFYFVLVSSFLIMAGVPRLLFCALGGFVFGFGEGLLLSQFSSLIGSFIAFRAARWGGREWLAQRLGKHRYFGRIVLSRPSVASVFMIRLLPAPNAVINFGLALGHVGNRAFLLGSILGFLPEGVVAVVVGSGMAEDIPWAGAAKLGVAGLLLLVIFLRGLRKRREVF